MLHQEGTGYIYFTPSTFQKAAQAEQNPKIPSPSLFSFHDGDRPPSKPHTALPSIAECAAHLELLQAFRHLRLQTISSEHLDKLLGIELNQRTVYRKVKKGYHHYEHQQVKLRDLTFDERRETKWSLLLSLAAVRFLKWVEAIEKDQAEPVFLPPIGMFKPHISFKFC